jgi:hypothetical protein
MEKIILLKIFVILLPFLAGMNLIFMLQNIMEENYKIVWLNAIGFIFPLAVAILNITLI